MLRVTRVSGVGGDEELRAEGWIAGEYVSLLERVGEDTWGRGARGVLDLTGVESIDDAGIALLQRWSEGGEVVLRGASPFIRLVLAQHRMRSEEREADAS